MLSIVIVTYNSAEVLPGLLASLPEALADAGPYRVVVVDNASADASVALAAASAVAPRIVATGRNAGYAAGINAALAEIGAGDDVLILNPDIRLRPGSVRLLLDRLADRFVGVVVPQIVDEEDGLMLSLRREPSLRSAWAEAILGGRLATRLGLSETVGPGGIYREGGAVVWATGAALLVSAAARRAVGRWDETYFLYSEEVDYMRRIRKAGLAIRYAPEAVATHIGGESGVNPRLYALLTANKVLYFRRHHGVVASALYRLAVLTGEAIRMPRGAVHRAALKALVGGPVPNR